ncbi:MAG: alkaline phosphatase family protein [Solirubrobacteraceae bacterium]
MKIGHLRLTIAIMATVMASATGLASAASAALPPIKHVFIIVLENESESASFGASSPAPFLSQTLRSEGAFLPNYFGIGHSSLDNYIAMIGGQPPNPITQADCTGISTAVTPDSFASFGASKGNGCQYPADVPTIASQLTAGHLTWRGYMDSMGSDPTREASTCAHPALGAPDPSVVQTATDQYATRHDPFVYYQSITSDRASCDSHVVNLNALGHDLSSVAATPNYTFITPGLCNDGHDTNCPNMQPGGLTQVNTFLQHWVPQITNSPAFKRDGLLLVTFDEGVSDDSACCGEIAGPAAENPGGGGPGGGKVGAVLLSPFIKPGTVSETAYNHYSMLGSVEDLFGLSHLGYAQLPGETDFGSDIYTNAPKAHPTPVSRLKSPALASSTSPLAKVKLRFSATTSGGSSVGSFDVQALDLSVKHRSVRTLAAATTRTSLTFAGRPGHTYEFRVAAVDSSGETGAFATSKTVIPSGVRPADGHYDRQWKTVKRRGAWLGEAIQSSTPGARFTLRYVGATLTLIGETTPAGGSLAVTLDGHSRTLKLHSAKVRRRLALGTFRSGAETHHLKLTVLSGTVALEGYGIAARTG